MPSNEGRGYVLRRLLRRAARHGRLLGINAHLPGRAWRTPLFARTARRIPSWKSKRDYDSKSSSRVEEESFCQDHRPGPAHAERPDRELAKGAAANGPRCFSGEDAFKLNDTFGFPLDLTKEIVAERGITVDEERFQPADEGAAGAAPVTPGRTPALIVRAGRRPTFSAVGACRPRSSPGYDHSWRARQVLAYPTSDELVDAVATDDGEKEGVLVVLDRTPFYAESGGQVGGHRPDSGGRTAQIVSVMQ